MPDTTLVSSMQSALLGCIGGGVATGLNYLLTRRKYLAETRKLEYEAEKIRRELENAVASIPAAVGYITAGIAERLLYTSTGRELGYDFDGKGVRLSRTVNGKSEDFGPPAAGSFGFEGDTINIHRANIDGRYQLWLANYLIDGKEMRMIPKDESIEGDRLLRISCKARVVNGQHTLRFVLADEANKWLAHTDQTITENPENTWTPLNTYFQVSAAKQCHLRIDDLNVSKAPSSVYIRDLVLAEKTARSAD